MRTLEQIITRGIDRQYAAIHALLIAKDPVYAALVSRDDIWSKNRAALMLEVAMGPIL